MSNLKQGTLDFPSAKRPNTTSNVRSQQKTLATEKGKNKRVKALAEVKSNAEASETLEISSEEEGTSAEISVPAKRTRASTKRQISSGNTKQLEVLSQPSQSEKWEPSPAKIERNHLDVKDKAGRYRKYYNQVTSKTEHVPPIHAEGQNKIHQMLRFFDMSYEFGPCIGMTRLQRWERAEALGLDPPVEVRDILLTQEGIEKTEYVQCVLNGEV